MGRTGKYEIGNYETGADKYLATFRKSCQCHDVGNVILRIWWKCDEDMMVSVIVHICLNNLNGYINSSTTQSIEQQVSSKLKALM